MTEHRLYRPSNANDSEAFTAAWCKQCADFEGGCAIEARAIMGSVGDADYPREWNYTIGGVPQCEAFIEAVKPEPRCDLTVDMFSDDGGPCQTP